MKKLILVDHLLTLHMPLPPPVQRQDRQVSPLTIPFEPTINIATTSSKFTVKQESCYLVSAKYLDSYTSYPSSNYNFVYSTKSYWDIFTSQNEKPCHTTKPNCGTNPYWGTTPFSGHIPTGGKPSFHTPITTRGKPPLLVIPQLLPNQWQGEPQPSYTGNPPQSWGPPQGGQFHQPHQGGPSNPNLQGGIPNPNPSRLHFGQCYLEVPNPTWGP
jgi:hypothetical protein